MKQPRRWVAIAIALGVLAFWLAIPSLPDPLFPPHYSGAVLDRDGKVLRAFLAQDEQWRLASRDKNLPTKLSKAVLTFEDRRFRYHPGVDVIAIARAAIDNLRGRSLSGASTISMQVARLAVPKERTFWSKVVEAVHALQIEWRYDKDEILRLWLDNTPYGGNLVGMEAASRRYYGMSPSSLSWGQASFLAVLPKSPNAIATAAGRDRLSGRQKALLESLDLNEEELAAALREPLPEMQYDLPFEAPHAAEWLHATRGGVISSTLRQAEQRVVAGVVERRADVLRAVGVPNLAVLVAETESGDVVAYAGSQSFADDKGNGQVDGVRAPRSSGSTLKPFLYGIAMDRGLMLPQTKLLDVPTNFGSFTPANFANEFSGLLSMRDALIKSANVPAVRTLADVDVSHFYEWLKAAGVSTLFRRSDDYGLSLILGGAEVTLWDLAALFRGLARGGQFGPLRIVADDSPPKSQQLMSPGAAWLVTETLRDVRRPGAEYYWEQYANQWPVAWKTGTSYGQRDAWAIGVTPEWTIAVWAGDFRGQGNPVLSGTQTAAPVLFDVLAVLPKDDGKRWFERPGDQLESVELCALSGYRAHADCAERVVVDAPRGSLPIGACPFHRAFYVENKEEVCSLCWTGKQERLVRTIYPPSVNQWYRQHGRAPEEPPPHRASCPATAQHQPLELLHPQPGTVLVVPRVDGEQHGAITLRAAHARDDAIVHWYLDGDYLGSTESQHQRSVVLGPGEHRVQVVDDQGNHRRHRFAAVWRAD